MYTPQTCPPGLHAPGGKLRACMFVYDITKNLPLIVLSEFQKVYTEKHAAIQYIVLCKMCKPTRVRVNICFDQRLICLNT